MKNPSRDHNKRTISIRGIVNCQLIADTGETHTWLDESAVLDENNEVAEGGGISYQRTVPIQEFRSIPVQIKLKAKYEQWGDLYQSFEDESSITFKQLEPLLTIPGSTAEREEKIKILQEYATHDPAGFAWGIYYEFVCEANVLNPLLILKARGGSPYPANIDMKELKRVSRWLFVFTQYWLTQPEKSWPEEFQSFLNRHNIRVQDDELDDCDVVAPNATALTLACIEKVYFTETENEDFYNNYVTRTPLTRIRSALSAVQHSPARYPLKDFLKM